MYQNVYNIFGYCIQKGTYISLDTHKKIVYTYIYTEVLLMSITYRLNEILSERGLNKSYLRKNGFNPKTVDRLVKNISVTIDTINDLCNLLHCEPNDIIVYTPDDN